MTASPSRVPARIIKSRSRERSLLAAHQQSLDDAAGVIQAARQPVQDLKARIVAASEVLQDTVSARDSIVAAEAVEVRRSGAADVTVDFGSQIVAAEAQIARAKRVLAALETQLAELEAPLRDAELTASIMYSQTEKLVHDVAVAEARAAVAAFIAAGTAAAQAESKARSAVQAIVEKRWFIAAESLNIALDQARILHWSEALSIDKWTSLIGRLSVDADATLET